MSDLTQKNTHFSAWLKAMRIHQWVKNLLIFVPLVLSGHLERSGHYGTVLTGFLLMSICASGTYILNDIRDIDDDRVHSTKRLRPFASGRLDPAVGRLVGVSMIVAASGGSYLLSPIFCVWLIGYVLASFAYSYALKAVAIVDVGLLACLYAVRLAMGAQLAEVPLSNWLEIFALTFFLSLSLAKRHAEIVKAARLGSGSIGGRGYRTGDAGLTLSLGVSAGMAALLVLVLFLVFQAFQQRNYVHPQFLWSIPFVTFFWISRVWLYASRGELDDDPVVFALTDRVSLGLGSVLLGAVLLAVLPW